MKNNKTVSEHSIFTLREDLRLEAHGLTERLHRSVGRLTSCERQPCLEYGEEIAYQRVLAERLFYLQHCRDTLEKCISTGKVVLRYHWQDGTVSITRFRKLGPARVQLTGFVAA